MVAAVSHINHPNSHCTFCLYISSMLCSLMQQLPRDWLLVFPDAAVSKDNTSDSNFDASLLQILLEEIRNLRVQLQKSTEANIALKDKLEEQLGRSLNSSGKISHPSVLYRLRHLKVLLALQGLPSIGS